ncbi:hypothetical protein LZ31DRAFT_364267 [Colletotrichum somersetense]|nr:hypothetical protein LZ31DRAFT_364267 [Colletotrichum somersetense]
MLGNFFFPGLSFTNGLLNAAGGEFQVPSIDDAPGKQTASTPIRDMVEPLFLSLFISQPIKADPPIPVRISYRLLSSRRGRRSWCCCCCCCCGGGYIHQIPPIHSLFLKRNVNKPQIGRDAASQDLRVSGPGPITLTSTKKKRPTTTYPPSLNFAA